MTIDWTKPILWDGKPARVLATDMKDGFEHPVLVRDEYGVKAYSDLAGCLDGVQRVTNVPERVERWGNAYRPPWTYAVCGTYSTKAEADEAAEKTQRTALVRYVFEGDKLVSAEVVPLEGE